MKRTGREILRPSGFELRGLEAGRTAMPRQIITTANAPSSPLYSQGVKADPLRRQARGRPARTARLDPDDGIHHLTFRRRQRRARAQRYSSRAMIERWTSDAPS